MWDTLYKMPNLKYYFRLSSGWKYVSSGRDTALAINQNDEIFSFEIVSFDESGNMQFELKQLWGNLSKVSVHKGVAWGVSADNKMWKASVEEAKVGIDAWVEIDNPFRINQIEIGEFGVFGTNGPTEVFYRVGTHKNSDSAGTRWQLLAGRLTHISSGFNSVYGVSHDTLFWEMQSDISFNDQGEMVWQGDLWNYQPEKTGINISTL